MYEGQLSLVDVYINDIWVGVGSLFQTWDGHVTGTMALSSDKLRDIHTTPPDPTIYGAFFSFADKFSRKLIGYFHYDSGTVECMENKTYVTRAVLKKSLLDVSQREPAPTFMYLGMGEDEK